MSFSHPQLIRECMCEVILNKEKKKKKDKKEKFFFVVVWVLPKI